MVVMIDKFAVIGNPIEHSLSPKIHQLFSKQQGKKIDYKKILSTNDKFSEEVQSFFKAGGIGMNVTIPFKEIAFVLSNSSDYISEICNASNTLYCQDNKIKSYNTDGPGLISDLNNKSIKTKSKKILILGAGGSSKSVLIALGNSDPASLNLFNRTQNKALHIQKNLKCNTQIQIYEEGMDFDLVINTTSVSLLDSEINFPNDIFAKDSIAYDLFYSKNRTKFELWSSKHGASRSYNGIGMLIEQAALSYEIWNGYKPKTKDIRKELGF